MTPPLDETIFERASRVFECRTDPETSLGVFRLVPTNLSAEELCAVSPLRTVYHQESCFLDGGRTVLLTGGSWTPPGEGSARRDYCLDLTTGELFSPFPEGRSVVEISDRSRLALVWTESPSEGRGIAIHDLRERRDIAAFFRPGWDPGSMPQFLSDGRRALVVPYQGRYYDEPCRSEIHLLDPDSPGETGLVLEAQGFFCNHLQGSPADPDVFAYDRWPTPKRPTDVVIHVASLDGSLHRPLPQLETTVRPGSIWGGQRDHYLWLPDGRRIASYFSPIDSDSRDHFDFGWWLSVTDWRTGEDVSVEYPPDRWGCNFQLTPDGRFVVSAGGRGFQRLYAVDIEALRSGWNERVCGYPRSEESRESGGPFHYPFVLPDQSAVVFTAGWPGPEDGVHMVELPRELRARPTPWRNLPVT